MEYTPLGGCNLSVLDPFSLERMYVKLAPHSPAPTPDRVDARNCGLSLKKVADQGCLFLFSCLKMLKRQKF